MSYKKHYLSEKNNNKYCPLKRVGYICDSHCAWFDSVAQDCRKILSLQDLTQTIFDGFDALFQKP